MLYVGYSNWQSYQQFKFFEMTCRKKNISNILLKETICRKILLHSWKTCYQLHLHVSKMPEKHSLPSSEYILFFDLVLKFIRVTSVVNFTHLWRCNLDWKMDPIGFTCVFYYETFSHLLTDNWWGGSDYCRDHHPLASGPELYMKCSWASQRK